jgi:hypothetical protein
MREPSAETKVRHLRWKLRDALATLRHVRDYGLDGPWGRDLVINTISDFEAFLSPRRRRAKSDAKGAKGVDRG